MPHAMLVSKTGGPEVLEWKEVPMPEPGPGEVLIRHEAVGLNFIDIYHRSGLYPVKELPFTPGIEGCGIVEKLGEGVKDVKIGERVVYGLGPLGAYAEYRVIPIQWLFRVPPGLAPAQAAAVMMRGLTAHTLLRRVYRVDKQTTILVQAAAGGMGSLLVQWANYLGATVIGTAGNKEKAALAEELGCKHVIQYKHEKIVDRVMEITDGRGVNIAYDAVGKASFDASLESLMPMGMLVSYGQASGPIPPFDLSRLRSGSKFFTRPSVMDYKKDILEYQLAAAEFFTLVMKRQIRIIMGQTYRLQDAAFAHEELEAGRTKGASALVVD